MSAPPIPAAHGSPLARVLRGIVALLGSMELAVYLVLYLGVLTLLGTFAQIEHGLYQAQRMFFEGWSVPLWSGGWLRIPGAYPVLMLLFANIVVGGMVRLRWHLRNVGILIVHVGIAFLLVQGFVKLHYSTSGHLTLYERQKGASFVSFHEWELAVLRRDGDAFFERAMPAVAFEHAGETSVVLPGGDLPFQVEVRHFRDNCQAVQKGPMVPARLPVVGGLTLQEFPVASERGANQAGCYATVRDRRTGRVLHETILWGNDIGWPDPEGRLPRSFRRHPFTFEIDGVQWGLDLRRVTEDLPFEVQLDQFERVTYPGTEMAKEFSSFVTVRADGTEQRSHIYMNNPLRRDGYVLYQASWGPQGGRAPWFSQFEVARNPSDRWSVLACAIIAVGLLVHFLRKLWRYIRAEELESAYAKGGTP